MLSVTCLVLSDVLFVLCLPKPIYLFIRMLSMIIFTSKDMVLMGEDPFYVQIMSLPFFI